MPATLTLRLTRDQLARIADGDAEAVKQLERMTNAVALMLRAGGFVAVGTLADVDEAVALVGSPVGCRTCITDSTATTTAGIGAVVVGGGANVVPAYFDGVDWRIG